ncbi:MAG: hypothetical protein WB543_14330 [Candidatus Acidiferrum sp.]
MLLTPVTSSSEFADRYRKIPNGWAFLIAAVASLILAVISGILGGFAGTYLYDRGMSRGDDFAVFLGGFYAVGTFTFVVLFTWLQKAHHTISSRTSLFAFYACLVLPALITVMSADEMDYYSMFIVGDWLAILIFGALSLFMCRRWWHYEEQGF